MEILDKVFEKFFGHIALPQYDSEHLHETPQLRT